MKKNTAQEGNMSTIEDGVAVVHLNIRDARARLSSLVNGMENSSSIFSLGRRKVPTTLLVPYDRYNPIFSRDYKLRLAFMIVENLLGDAPLHIRNPQLAELTQLDKDDLLLLAGIEKLPLGKAQEKELRESLTESKVLDRLIKRHQIAGAIASAQKEGLYEAAEHLTSSIDLKTKNTTEDASRSAS
ncbi:MAG: hypothetical protein PHU25_06910 [Deltaproteobacteria bacterium]|nr:hypothetical protein [Deltaproteobacteria bacterium]